MRSLLQTKIKNRFTNIDQLNAIEKVNDFCNQFSIEHKIYNFEFADSVIEVLLNVMADYNTIISALFYPLIKNSLITLDEILDKSNSEVKEILLTLQKIEQLKINTKENQAQNVKDMFIALAKDIRVIILKLAITQVEVLNIDEYDKDQQKLLMHQAKEVFAPLAAMIGIGHIKSTLENEIFKFFEPLEYAHLNKILHKYVEDRNNQIKISIEKIKQEIDFENALVYGRQKQISSIHKKMIEGKKDLSQIFDILAIRVIVDTVEQCYMVLGKIHALYTPVGRFKDYIAQPKENGYQSLHTTVIVENGDPLEIQIRTHDMHSYAEYGIAAHWAYKEKRKVNESDKKISYIRSIMELHKEKSPEELLDALKIDVYSGNIFCQTPMGKIIQFPEGATPVDFAYAIHSKVGDTCVGAKINGKIVPLATPLKNGDVVEIITNPNSKGPSRDWLQFVKADARGKINSFFKREMKEENIKRGKSILENAAKAKNINLSRILLPELLDNVYERYALANMDEMYAALGYGGVTANQILTRLVNLYNELNKDQDENLIEIDKVSKHKIQVGKSSLVSVLGYSNLMTKFAKCCSPLPGDEIIGYVSRGKGVTIHRVDCDVLNGSEEERLIECTWNTKTNDLFEGSITIIALNSPNTLATISRKIGDLKLNIASVKSQIKSRDEVIIHFGIFVNKKEQLEDLISKLNNLSCVVDIYRTK